MDAVTEYDPRYLAGIRLFNRREFFEAHEVWEDLWRDCDRDLRRFYQGLIQAAVSLHHWGNGNWRGAKRLFQSGRTYMSAYPENCLGLKVAPFWQQMERAVTDVLNDVPPPDGTRLDENLCPVIELVPPPIVLPTRH